MVGMTSWLGGAFIANGSASTTSPAGNFTTATLGPVLTPGAADARNQYEVQTAIDPSDFNRRAISCKWGIEEGAIIFWTNDGWATTQKQTFNVGDPVVEYAVNGDLILVALPRDNSQLGCWINVGGNSPTFNTTKIAMGIPRDRPSICVDRSPTSPYYGTIYVHAAKGNRTDNGTYLFRSTDHGRTWSRALAFTQESNPNTTSVTTMADGTVVAMCHWGATYKYFTVRSTDGGVTFDSPITTGFDGAIGSSGRGSWADCRIASDGTNLYVAGNKNDISWPAGFQLTFRKSADKGLTWTAEKVLWVPPNGYGVASTSIASTAKAVTILFFVVEGQWLANIAFRVYTMSSFDQGATWTPAVELSTMRSPWTFTTTAPGVAGAGQTRDAGEDFTTIKMYGDKAFVSWSEGPTDVIYTIKQRVISFT